MILPKIALTPSGRPQLLANEIERLLLDKVDLEFEGIGGTEGCQTADRYQSGYVVVTSHRVVWIDAGASPSPGRSCFLPLESIHSSSKRVQYGLNLMNPKVRLELKVYVDLRSQPCDMQNSATFRYLQLRCRGEGPDAFQEHLVAAMQALRQQQEKQQQRQQQQLQQQQRQQQQLQQQQASKQMQQAMGAGPLWGGPVSGRVSAPSGLPPPAAVLPPAAGQSSAAGRMSLPAGSLQGRMSPAAGQGPAPLQQQQQPLQAVDKELLAALLDMGFPRPRVLAALMATHSEHLQAALDWILAAGEDPSMDQALAPPEPSQVSRQELILLRQQQQQQQQQQHMRPAAELPGWGVGSVAAAAAAGAGSQAAGVWPPVAAAASGPGNGGGLLYSSSSGPAGYSSTGPGPLPVQQQQQQRRQGSVSTGSRVVGVAGIMHREAERSSQTSASLAVAFRDLDALMAMAADMVKLAEKFRGVMGPDGCILLSSMQGAGSAGAAAALDDPAAAASGEQLLLDADTQLQLIAMGIASPVTKASAGARYHQELSRQLADFLAGPLARAGGVMMLPDVYCLFNRARGSELVSPDDLLQACEAFSQVGLPLRLRKFSSGVIVVQGSQFSDAQLCRRIEQLLQQKMEQPSGAAACMTGSGVAAGSPAAARTLGPPLSATDVSAALSLPLTLAREALLVAESHGVLCRDDGTEGLRFFRNFFAEAQPVAV